MFPLTVIKNHCVYLYCSWETGRASVHGTGRMTRLLTATFVSSTSRVRAVPTTPVESSVLPISMYAPTFFINSFSHDVM